MTVGEIDKEILRLESVRDNTQALLDADIAKHVSEMSFTKQEEWSNDLTDIVRHLAKLREIRRKALVSPVLALPAVKVSKPSRSTLPEIDEEARALDRTLMSSVARRYGHIWSPEQMKQAPSREEMLADIEVITEAFVALKRRVEILEEGGIKYCGVHQRAISYTKGSFVSFGGSGWVSLRAAGEGELPGKSDAWQLAVKAGRDAS